MTQNIAEQNIFSVTEVFTQSTELKPGMLKLRL